MGKDCGLGVPRVPSARLLFRAAPALLEFLEDTRVGRMPGQILAGGLVEGESDLEELEMRPQGVEEEEAVGSEESEEEDGSGPPLKNTFSFLFLCLSFSFLWLQGMGVEV